MQHDSKVRMHAVALALVGLVLASGCTSLSRRAYPRERPANVSPRYDSNGNVDVADLDRQVSPYRTKPPHQVVRSCKNPVQSCPLDVQEIGLSWDIDPGTGIDQYAGQHAIRVVGQFTNKGNGIEARYDLQPNQTYYVWVMDTVAASASLRSKMIWGFMTRGHGRETMGYLIRCHDHSTQLKRSQLGFEPCSTSPTVEFQTKTGSGFAPGSIFAFASREAPRIVRRTFTTSETWFECDPGCCTGTTSFAQ